METLRTSHEAIFFRGQIFTSWIEAEKKERDEIAFLNPNDTGKVMSITVRRDFIYEDAFDKLRPENGELLESD